ncbi:uncharacterized protein G2W53_030226 [Senna tora]|uniref:Uncharacterized protein n=1 Tax=Senna tora TaxID=362788 RepID=A0A834T8V8_9FABA|nr:uncharacterized protein G2W53_030226 [Senna tora]
MKNLNESKHGFWDVLARKAKSILDDDNVDQQHEMYERTGSQMPGTTSRGKFSSSNHLEESNSRRDNSKLFKGLGAFTSSLSHIGGTIGNALEEGITIVENRTSGIIHETRKHIKKNPGNSEGQSQDTNTPTSWKQSQLRAQMQTDQELQLKASRDVAMAMAAKAKLLLRELKTVKADLAFAKERCAQLEEENKSLRENRERGGNLEDDDLGNNTIIYCFTAKSCTKYWVFACGCVRLQLETLLAEKARLANENSIYARENRFLREVVEYHQLTMQDVVYLDESNEEVTEVNPLNLPPEVTRNISSSITGKDAKSSEVTRSISSITGKGT